MLTHQSIHTDPDRDVYLGKKQMVEARIFFRSSYETYITSNEVSFVELIVFVNQFAMSVHLPIQHLSNIFGRHLSSGEQAQDTVVYQDSQQYNHQEKPDD